ncbi:Porin [Azospirillaceae bacterium]
MNVKLLIIMIVGLFSCAAQAQNGPEELSDGFGGSFLNNITFQKSTEDALRNRPSPFRRNLVTDTGGRLLNLLELRFKSGNWTFMGSYTDNRTLGDGSAYSLSNPLTFGVNTVNTSGANRDAVDYKSGLHELTTTYRNSGKMVMLGKIDTSNWYLYDPIFSGDLRNGNDYGNAATRVVAPPFPSMALVVKQDFGNGLSLTGIAGDAFGDRETIDASRNLVNGDLAYVLEINYYNNNSHYQITFNHVDAFHYYDKDAVWPGPGYKAPKVDAVMATASYRFDENWAGFARFSYSTGEGRLEDVNYLVGARYDFDKFYALASQSATRIGTDSTPYNRGAKGDYTFVSELTLNYKVLPEVTVGATYDAYNSNGNSLLAKDGGWNGSRSNHIVGMRVTTFLPF